MDRFRFQKPDLQTTLAGLYTAAGLPFETGGDGFLCCGDAFAARAEALRSVVRSQRFADWQTHCVLDDPENDPGEYRNGRRWRTSPSAPFPSRSRSTTTSVWLLLPEDEVLPDSLWESAHGSRNDLHPEHPACCFCQRAVEDASFGEISVRRPDGGFRSVLYAHLGCLRERVHPAAIHIIETTD